MHIAEIGWSNRLYIDDFIEDLNYVSIILYIGNVDTKKLLERLEKDMVNKTYRLDYALTKEELSKKNFIYIENCDLQDLDYPVWEYMEEDEGPYDVYVLHEDKDGNYYIVNRVV